MAVYTVDDYLNNEKWVTRVKQAFDRFDINKNGTLEEADLMRLVENIKKDVNPDPALLDNLTKAMGNYTTAMGLAAGNKHSKDEFLKASAEMAVAEKARKAKGEKTLGNFVNEAWHAVVDKNHDGFVTKDEYRTIMKASNFNAEMADKRFDAMDTNKNGKIELKELHEAEEKFWFDLDN